MDDIKDVGTVLISCVALILSTWAAMRTWRYNVSNLRKAAHGSYMSALFDINKQLISYPQLHAIYTDSGVPSDLEATRRTAFIWYHLNLFETVFAHYNHYRIVPLDDVETGYWNSWQEFMRSFVLNSSEVKAFLCNKGAMRLLNPSFVDHLQKHLAEADSGRKLGQKARQAAAV